MSYCTDCIHYKVCGNEGVDDVAMNFCADKQVDGDLISRQDAINCFNIRELKFKNKEDAKLVKHYLELAFDDLVKLSSYNSIKTELNEDLISRTDLLKDITELKKSPWFNDGKDIKDLFQQNSYVARKEAIEIIEDLCIKKLPRVKTDGDLISRQAVLDLCGNREWLDEYRTEENGVKTRGYDTLKMINYSKLLKLPSAEKTKESEEEE